MNHVLKHIESITRQRDRSMLDLGIVSALYELLKATEVNLYQTRPDAPPRFQHMAHMGSNGVHYAQSELETSPHSHTAQHRPDLQTCYDDCLLVFQHRPQDQRFVYCFPVIQERRVASILELIRDTPLTEDERGTAEGFLALYRNFVGLLDYSERDTLTGLLNRRTFEQHAERILRSLSHISPHTPNHGFHARRHGERNEGAYWLAVLDVDHFKRVNDQFGHLYGDEVLLQIARLMRDSFRHEDRLFRFGGEEFIVLLRAQTEAQLCTALERFRHAVATYRFEQIGQMTVSIGYTAIQPDDSIGAIIRRADEALYAAKHLGRNQTRSFEHLPGNAPSAPRPIVELAAQA
ncbi:MAG: GGDEF domain-containing protein [Rhodocyclales bacterium]|nr:GGDEF domain-containing protein [Rhodocyclales bacterium]